MSTTIISKLHKIAKENTSSQFTLWLLHKSSTSRGYNAIHAEIDTVLSGKLLARLKQILLTAKRTHPYAIETAELEEEEALTTTTEDIPAFQQMLAQINRGSDNAKLKSEKELNNTYGYIMEWSLGGEERILAFRRAPDKWSAHKMKGVIWFAIGEKKLVGLEDKPLFRFDTKLDFIAYGEEMLILDKKGFEAGLNFRKGIEEKKDKAIKSITESGRFKNPSLLKEKVEGSFVYARKLAAIEKAGYIYKPDWLAKLERTNANEHWNLKYEDGKILLTDDTIDSWLIVLQNGRLKSPVDGETFDTTVKHLFSPASS